MAPTMHHDEIDSDSDSNLVGRLLEAQLRPASSLCRTTSTNAFMAARARHKLAVVLRE